MKNLKYKIRRLISKISRWWNIRWQRKLFRKYPDLFKQTKLSRSESCMYYGIETGKGWAALIDNMSAELSLRFPDVEYAQLKEKFGTLRVYLDNVDKDSRGVINNIISQYESLSASTCEVCGAVGERQTSENGWISVRCNKCK